MISHVAEVITFDCYGTLIDWESGIANAFMAEGGRVGHTLDREEIVRTHAEVEPEVQRGRYQSYREVLRQTARIVAQRLGWTLAPDHGDFLAESLPHWPPFPDTNRSLEYLVKAGYRLGILSNIDDDLLSATLKHFTVEFEFCVTAERVQSYKPAPAHFLAARDLMIAGRRWLHAAQSVFHDIEPAGTLGIPAAWINRHGGVPRRPVTPLVTVPALEDLVDWVGNRHEVGQ